MSSIHEIPGTIIQGRSEPTPEDFAKVEADTAIEKSWFTTHQPYQTNGDILRAGEEGELVHISPTQYAVPVMRFRAPELRHLFPPYLRANAANALWDIGRLWHRIAVESGVSPAARLAVTSLTRSKEYQTKLIEEGKLATEGSSHTYGWAFDLSLSDYYLEAEDGSYTSVSLRSPEQSEEISRQFMVMGAKSHLQPKLGPESFDYRVPKALLGAADMSKMQGDINPVLEFIGTDNSCLHLGVHPSYEPHLE